MPDGLDPAVERSPSTGSTVVWKPCSMYQIAHLAAGRAGAGRCRRTPLSAPPSACRSRPRRSSRPACARPRPLGVRDRVRVVPDRVEDRRGAAAGAVGVAELAVEVRRASGATLDEAPGCRCRAGRRRRSTFTFGRAAMEHVLAAGEQRLVLRPAPRLVAVGVELGPPEAAGVRLVPDHDVADAGVAVEQAGDERRSRRRVRRRSAARRSRRRRRRARRGSAPAQVARIIRSTGMRSITLQRVSGPAARGR